MKLFFTKKLLLWNKKYNRRAMPWKGEKDPYKIWLSEIILQQTRVEQGWNYYLKFIKKFPTVQQLAHAPETTIFKLWEGLGYYSRCKNLIAAARIIDKDYGGRFPAMYEKILELPGIGPYTAAAIASFAFNLPYAVVDGNVLRVLARIGGIKTPADSAKGKTLLNKLAFELLDKKQPGLYNQAIMDFGAVVCKPKSPDCRECIMQTNCRAYQLGLVAQLPVKEKKIVKKNRWLYYFIITYKSRVYIRKRTAKDIWQNLHEFLLVEKDSAITKKNWLLLPPVKQLLSRNEARVTKISRIYTQQLTHQTVRGQFIEISVNKAPDLGADFTGVTHRELGNYPFPKFMITYLQEKNVNLSQH
ncbi:A/G-specific adenine glycosylase [Agriterribacter sp.]|uniref:A/G-specific adenine glycosylase n=1 Tax=Agriterribacter sp. TaxID=2821509 RepID=UPI002BF09BF0|nr:A/G-specific adenine glycosylase [Agriterribacter sp.]HRO47411.1 A/G-specific adenine glycosylase [Agriterribacter sp.]HRQ16587.1 A/G-specific adenine glycosylase [Agriterribacter sp.]